MRSVLRLVAIASLTACVVGGPDSESSDLDLAGGKADATGTCSDAKYGDGVCHISLACGVPDIDCFRTFDNAAASKAWCAESGVRLIKATDPRVARARKLVDRAWAQFTARYPLGRLTSMYLPVEVVDEAEANAFVAGDEPTNKQVFAVFITAPMLSSAYTDDDILGVLAHELAHMARLHSFPEVKESVTRHYTAGTSEPIGALQVDRPTARTAVERFQAIADLIGSDMRVELGGLPTGGSQGGLFQYLLGQLMESTNATCKANARAARDLYVDLVMDRELDDSIKIYGTTQNDAETVIELLAACPDSAVDVVVATVAERRAALRALAAELAQKGTPVGKLRYFSYEEQADDFSVRVTHDAGLSTVGSSAFAVKVLGAKAAECQALRANNAVPYGDLLDAHHGLCWRLAHMHQYKASFATQAAVVIDDVDDIIDHPIVEAFVPTRRVSARIY